MFVFKKIDFIWKKIESKPWKIGCGTGEVRVVGEPQEAKADHMNYGIHSMDTWLLKFQIFLEEKNCQDFYRKIEAAISPKHETASRPVHRNGALKLV